jgi:hypothetical protein
MMALPYSQRRILWPRKLVVPAVLDQPYDLMEVLRGQFDKYPSVSHDDLLDAHAYAYEMAGPRQHEGWQKNVRASLSRDPSIYTREQAVAAAEDSSLAGYDQGSGWELGL